jgi:hypothetical protein
MDDQMMGSMAGNTVLGRRLEAYAELRLSPDLATSSRLRARVLAVAHRQASLTRGDAGLTIMSQLGDPARAQSIVRHAPRTAGRATWSPPRGWQRVAAVVLAASLGSVMVAGAAFAARPGGPLYEGRVWAETLTLPTDPSARALAELDRLEERLREIGTASRAGDVAGTTAALEAYESIMEEATAAAILAGDDVAAAVVVAGVGRNVVVLQALAGRVPGNASDAITSAVDAAIERSGDAIDRIGTSRPDNDKPSGGGDHDGAGGAGPAAAPTPRATQPPTDKPTKAPVATPTSKPKPTPQATPVPSARPEPVATPTRTPKPKPDKGKPADSPHPAGQ